jgi:hypothetical protein
MERIALYFSFYIVSLRYNIPLIISKEIPGIFNNCSRKSSTQMTQIKRIYADFPYLRKSIQAASSAC